MTVIFAVGAGGGSVTGGTQTTNASGVATVGSWTLPEPLEPTHSRPPRKLPPVTFTATARVRAACSVATPHTFGTTSSGDLATSDCRESGGQFVDFFSTTISPAGAFVFTEVAPTFDAYLLLYGPDGWLVGVNDDADPSSNPASQLDSRIKVLLPSANYILGATSFDPGATGGYTLSSAQTPAAINGCEDVFVARRITTDQILATTDCLNGAVLFRRHVHFPEGGPDSDNLNELDGDGSSSRALERQWKGRFE